MDFRFFPGDIKPNERATLRPGRYLKHAANQFSTFAHSDQPDPALHLFRHKARAMILHFKLQEIRRKLQPDPGFARSGMPAHIIQRFLQDAIDVHAGARFHREGLPGLLLVQC